MFMIRMNNYSLNVCLPAMSRYFQVGPGAISRTVTAYLVVVTGSFLVFGKVSDRVGPRPVLCGASLYSPPVLSAAAWRGGSKP